MTLVLMLMLMLPTHAVGLSRGLYVVDDGDVDVELTFARADMVALVPAVDANADGDVTPEELGAMTSAIGLALNDLLVSRGDNPCALTLASAGIVAGDGVTLALRASCPKGTADVIVDFKLVQRLGAQHRHLGHVSAHGSEADVVAFAASPQFTLTGSASAPPVADYLLLGIEHILLGYDHLVFLFGILIVLLRAGSLRALVAVITAFTLAHTLTLGLAATGLVVPPSAVIEPLIALSIVLVGVESFFATDIAKRWRVTLPFGLIHGFGFAGALSEIGLPHDAIIPALGFFNLGVEIGQLAAVLSIYPLLVLCRRRLSAVHAERSVKILAVIVMCAGAYWVIERIS